MEDFEKNLQSQLKPEHWLRLQEILKLRFEINPTMRVPLPGKLIRKILTQNEKRKSKKRKTKLKSRNEKTGKQ
jgi:hypothetical protein